MSNSSIRQFFIISLWFLIPWKVYAAKDSIELLIPSRLNDSSPLTDLSPELPEPLPAWSNNATRLWLTFSADIVVSVKDTSHDPAEVSETFILRSFLPESFDNYRRYPSISKNNHSSLNDTILRQKRSPISTEGGQIKLMQIVIPIPYTNLDPQATGMESPNRKNLHISVRYDPQAEQYWMHRVFIQGVVPGYGSYFGNDTYIHRNTQNNCCVKFI